MTSIAPDSRSPKSVKFHSGVYIIRHKPSGRVYIGSSAEVEKRLYLHRVLLRVGRHHCEYLQNVWNKHEEQEFAFYLLEECSIADLGVREQFYLDSFSEKMNSQPIARSCRGYRHSDETRSEMSLSAMVVADRPGERERRSERAIQQHVEGRLGRHTWSEESKQKYARQRPKPKSRYPNDPERQALYVQRIKDAHWSRKG